LAKNFGKFTAVAELDLGIKQGEVLCLLGHNGAGKTTLINMLTGMLQPTTGDAVVFGHSLVYEIDKVR
jgi:ABC-type multidrug transport system ATPase subunit